MAEEDPKERSREDLLEEIARLQAKVDELEKEPNLCEILRSEKTSFATLIQSTSPFWATFAGPVLSKILDFIFIDTEHTPIDREQICSMCQMYRGYGLPALVRVVNADEARAALDAGAAGVVMPYMEEIEEVQALRGATKLRPFKGLRMREAMVSEVSGEIGAYIKKGGSKRALVLNIESQRAIDNLEQMLDPKYQVDAVLIGPHDLSCNLGVPEQFDHPKFVQAVTKIFEVARNAGVGAMMHFIGSYFGPGLTDADVAQYVKKGCNNVVNGSDLIFFMDGLSKSVAAIKGEKTDVSDQEKNLSAI